MAFLKTLLFLGLGFSLVASVNAAPVLIKDLTRMKGVRENNIVGYGLVTGLAGTGDSARSKATIKSISNVLKRFGLSISDAQIRSRNVAAVTLTARLPAYAQEGDMLDVNVSSIGDAKSLAGGTLLMAELSGPDKNVYAVAQGHLVVGGYRYDVNGNSVQKNHPTAAIITNGATVEKDVISVSIPNNGVFTLILRNPDISTTIKVVDAINDNFGKKIALAVNAANIRVKFDTKMKDNWMRDLQKIERIEISPNSSARVVINERTGTVVYGGNVKLSAVNITHGDIRISINNKTKVFVNNGFNDNGNVVVPNSSIKVKEEKLRYTKTEDGSSISDLVFALNKLNVGSHNLISILQAIKSAGALHADIIIQ